MMTRLGNREEVVFLKLGGSLITDKTAVEVLKDDVLNRLAAEIRQAMDARPQLVLLLGHGSGSFGHVAAAQFATRSGVGNEKQWMGFARVSDAAARLNRAVCAALLGVGLPAISLQPSASALCEDGLIVRLESDTIIEALQSGLIPVVYGDVAFDSKRGGTIISTEEIMSYLAQSLRPKRLLLAGATEGVLDQQGESISILTSASLPAFEASLGGSHGTDVTGGMLSKVKAMIELVDQIDGLSVRVFSGVRQGNVRSVLLGQGRDRGTLISSITEVD